MRKSIPLSLDGVREVIESVRGNGQDMSFYPQITKLGINTEQRWTALIAQCALESDFFTRTEENMHYKASTLMRVWPSRFKSMAKAKLYAASPEKLANYVYGGRMGNNTTSDGYKYRGRGYIQLTGKDNYTRAGIALGIDLVNSPGLAAEPAYAWLIAAWYMTTTKYKGRRIVQWADMRAWDKVSRAVNGGTHGLVSRRLYSNTIYSTFTGEDLPKCIVKVGSTGIIVRQVQSMLQDAGYRIYKVDGRFGKKTKRIVMGYQRDNKLVQDGIVGHKTYEKLYHSYIEVL